MPCISMVYKPTCWIAERVRVVVVEFLDGSAATYIYRNIYVDRPRTLLDGLQNVGNTHGEWGGV